MKALIKYIARALVDYPEDVEVSETEGKTTVVIGLKVAKEDIGKVLGKQGRTVNAMRIILSGASGKVRKGRFWRSSNRGNIDEAKYKRCLRKMRTIAISNQKGVKP